MKQLKNLRALMALAAVGLLLGASACTGGGEVVRQDNPDLVQKESEKDDIQKVIGVSREALDAFDGAVEELTKPKPELAKAEELLQRALSASPGFLEAQYNLGIVYERREQYDNAIAAYQKAQSLDKLNTHTVAIQLAIGRSQALAGRPQDALKTFEETARLAPENLDVLNSLAAAYLKAGKVDDASEYVQKVLREDNANVTALNTLAQIYTAQDNRSMAVYVFKKAARVALNANKTDEELQAEPAVLVLSEKVDRASIKGDVASDILNNLGMVYFKMGELPLAVYNFNAASALDAENVEARLNTGAVYLRYLNYAGAKKVFSEALTVAPDSCTAQLGLAASNFSLGELKESESGYLGYLSRCDEKHSTSHLQLEKVYEKLQDIPNAVKHCELFVQFAKPGESKVVTADYCKALATTTPTRTEPMQPEEGGGGEGGGEGGEVMPEEGGGESPPAEETPVE